MVHAGPSQRQTLSKVRRPCAFLRPSANSCAFCAVHRLELQWPHGQCFRFHHECDPRSRLHTQSFWWHLPLSSSARPDSYFHHRGTVRLFATQLVRVAYDSPPVQQASSHTELLVLHKLPPKSYAVSFFCLGIN